MRLPVTIAQLTPARRMIGGRPCLCGKAPFSACVSPSMNSNTKHKISFHQFSCRLIFFFSPQFSVTRPQEIVWRLCLVLSLNVALVVLSMVADIKIPTLTTVPHTLIGLPLGLLLVFRTNSAYARLRIFHSNCYCRRVCEHFSICSH